MFSDDQVIYVASFFFLQYHITMVSLIGCSFVKVVINSILFHPLHGPLTLFHFVLLQTI